MKRHQNYTAGVSRRCHNSASTAVDKSPASRMATNSQSVAITPTAVYDAVASLYTFRASKQGWLFKHYQYIFHGFHLHSNCSMHTFKSIAVYDHIRPEFSKKAKV